MAILILLTFMGGGAVGYLIAALMIASKRGDESEN